VEHRKLWRTGVFFALIYFIEGLVTALFGLSFLYLTGMGINPASLSVIIFIALIPLFFKPFVGVVTDKFTLGRLGRRKPWLLIGIVVQAAGFFGLSLIHPSEGLGLYMLTMCFAVAALVLYDTCVDGLALDLLTPDEYGGIQSWMTSGRYLAVLIAPPLATGLASNISWPAAFVALGVLSLLPVPVVLAVKEPPRGAEARQQFLLPVLRKALAAPGIFICVLGFLTMLATSGTEEIWLGYLRNEVGVPLGIVGWFGSIFGVGVILGAIAGARVYKAMGRIASNYVTIALIALSTVTLVTASEAVTAIIAAITFGLGMGMLHVTVFSLGMTLRVVGAEATSFGLFSVFLVTGTVVAMTVSPWLAGHIGYSWTFVVNGLFGCLGGLMVWILRIREAREGGLHVSAGRQPSSGGRRRRRSGKETPAR